jgi:hypothetical protein
VDFSYAEVRAILQVARKDRNLSAEEAMTLALHEADVMHEKIRYDENSERLQSIFCNAMKDVRHMLDKKGTIE